MGERRRVPRCNRVISSPSSRTALIAGLLGLIPSLPAQHGWVAESRHFRVLVQPAAGMDASVATAAADDLESFRIAFQRAGLGTPRRDDGPLEVLIVPHRLDLHALLGEPLHSRTRGITIRGLDRNSVIVPWHDPPGPRMILAHEYSHQLDGRGWPPWFSEGRAVYLARRTEPRTAIGPTAGLVAMLHRLRWIPWTDLFSTERATLAEGEEVFQAQSWLIVHWMASQIPELRHLSPEYAVRALAESGEEGLDTILRQHLAALRPADQGWLAPLGTQVVGSEVRTAEPWEVPLFEAEARMSIRMLDEAEAALKDLESRNPAQPRVLAASATMHLIRGRQDLAEQQFEAALRFGDRRGRTAFRYALLLMRPGRSPEDRADKALRHALRAREQLPRDPAHHLAVAHARMLTRNWNQAFAELRLLLPFEDWAGRAEKEAAEVRRRITQAVRTTPRPKVTAEAPAVWAPVSVPNPPEPWREPEPVVSRTSKRYRWPPHGTWLVHGRVSWVECDERGKRVIVHSPYRRLVLSENPDRPPRLINRPFRGNSLPCHARGWWVAIAYRKFKDAGEVNGEIVGIRF